MQKILQLLCFLFLLLPGKAQTISGTIYNHKHEPLPLVSVALVSGTSQQTLKADLSDSSGVYTFHHVKPGQYLVIVSATGYAETKSGAIRIDSVNKDHTGTDFQLTAITKEMQGVTVSSRKKLVEMLADKTVMNIENSIIATGNSAFDLLRKAPGVNIDAQENVKMKGQAVKIFIDDKPAFLSGEQLLNYLKNLQADEISKIELISNPGSKYPAEGTGGIINIRLKKNKRYGTNGTLAATGGYGTYPKLSGSGSLNYRNKKVNLFSSAGTGRFESFNQLDLNSIIGSGSNTIFQQRDNYWHPVTIYSNARAGIDYSFSDKSTLGFLARGTFSDEDATTTNRSLFTDITGKPQSYIRSVKDDRENNSNITLNLNYKKDIDSLGSAFNIDLDYGYYCRRGHDVNTNQFNNFSGAPRPDYIFRNTTPVRVDIYSLKADWTKYIDSSWKIESGVKLSLVKNNNELIADSVSGNQWVIDNARTNHFVYDENIYAAYITLSKEFKKLSVQAGLRGEYTHSNGNSITINRTDKRDYFNLFPTVFLNYKANQLHTLSLSYTYRINRPGYQSLNPFLNFVDPYTYFEGNPFLRPSYAHSVELKHGFRDFLFTSISYVYASNISNEVIQQDEATKISLSRTENVGSSRYIGLNISAGIPVTKWWSTDLSGNAGYGTERSTYPGYSYYTKAWDASFSSTNSFTLPKKIKAELSIYMNAPTRSGIAKVAGSVNLSAGVQKPVLKDKGSLKLSLNNFVGPTQYNALFRNESLHIKWINQWEGKRISLSFNYKFGNMNVKSSRQRRTASQEEGNRVNL